MSAQDRTEKVLRQLHVLISKSEPYPKEPSKVIIDKQMALDLLTELNQCTYQIMDEHEMTLRSRDRAEREFKRKGEEIIKNASRSAEDVYAASVMYTDQALTQVQEIMRDAQESVSKLYRRLEEDMKMQIRNVKSNQIELKSTLQDLQDTEKYLKLIDERNKQLAKQKREGTEEEYQDVDIYADRQTEIRINRDYFEQMGYAIEDEVEAELSQQVQQMNEGFGYQDYGQEIPMEDIESKMPKVEVTVDLDADYFKWKEQQESGEQPPQEEPSGGISKIWKNFTGKK